MLTKELEGGEKGNAVFTTAQESGPVPRAFMPSSAFSTSPCAHPWPWVLPRYEAFLPQDVTDSWKLQHWTLILHRGWGCIPGRRSNYKSSHKRNGSMLSGLVSKTSHISSPWQEYTQRLDDRSEATWTLSPRLSTLHFWAIGCAQSQLGSASRLVLELTTGSQKGNLSLAHAKTAKCRCLSSAWILVAASLCRHGGGGRGMIINNPKLSVSLDMTQGQRM